MNNPLITPLPPGLCGRCDKGRHSTNVGQWEMFKVILYHQETPWGASHRPLCQSGSVFPAIIEETLPEQLKNLMPIVRNHTAVDNRTTIQEKTKKSGETIKKLFLQTSISKQRSKLKIIHQWCHWRCGRHNVDVIIIS